MSTVLFGLTAADVATDSAGNVQPGRQAAVWTAHAGGSRYTATYEANDDNSLGSPTGGFVVSGPSGRVAFFAETRQPLWLDWGDGERWPVNPLDLDSLVSGSVDAAMADGVPQLVDEAVAPFQGQLDRMTDTLGEVSVSVGQFATPGQLDGTEDASSAWQAAVDTGAHRIVTPAGSVFWFDGSTKGVNLDGRSHLKIDLAGSTIMKTTTNGYYSTFYAEGTDVGYGASVTYLIVENGYWHGSYDDLSPASCNAFSLHHAQHVTVRNCIFERCQLQASHVFELDGCDGILIEDCVFYGYKPDGVSAPRTEAINIDLSQNGAGAAKPPHCDGLPCRNVTVRSCKFLPWTDPATGTKYPAGIPFGCHAIREGSTHENIVLENIYVEDPPKDNASTEINADNPWPRGLVHVPGVNNIRIQMTVVATDGQGTIRLVQLHGASNGVLVTDDPNADVHVKGDFTTPLTATNVDLDITSVGFNNPITPENPLIFVGGVSGTPSKKVHIRANVDGSYHEAVLVRNVEDADVQFTACRNALRGCRTVFSSRVRVGGNFYNVPYINSNTGSTHVVVGPATAHHDTPQGALIGNDSTTDYMSVVGVIASGYADLYSSPSPPVNHSEAGNVITP